MTVSKVSKRGVPATITVRKKLAGLGIVREDSLSDDNPNEVQGLSMTIQTKEKKVPTNMKKIYLSNMIEPQNELDPDAKI